MSLYTLRLGSELPSSIPPSYLNKWTFHILEKEDLDAASLLALDSFYTPRLTINSKGMSGIELWVGESIINSFNSFDKFDTFITNKWGFESRSRSRLTNPSLRLSSESFILAATVNNDKKVDDESNLYRNDVENYVRDDKKNSKPDRFSQREGSKYGGNGGNEGKDALVGIVEIGMEKPDGNLAPAVQIFPRPPPSKEDQPYLCNLCVSRDYRRQGLGKALCQLGEQLVMKHWARNKLYLHVEESNIVASALYQSMGYTITKGLNPLEAKLKGMQNIKYYVKNLILDDWGNIHDN